uniref:Uncharacterized protein n=1 Tax=Amphimedon queenslandica TaxID=400682 RepID=A0A1X7SLB8_AMPQE
SPLLNNRGYTGTPSSDVNSSGRFSMRLLGNENVTCNLLWSPDMVTCGSVP